MSQFENYIENLEVNNVSQTSVDESVSFYADSGHFYLAHGITHINGIPVIQNSLPNEPSQRE